MVLYGGVLHGETVYPIKLDFCELLSSVFVLFSFVKWRGIVGFLSHILKKETTSLEINISIEIWSFSQ